MSNRGRQNVASYLVLDMGVDWRKGADWFETILQDYDVCSNWGNWVSAAGLTGGRINHFNITKQLHAFFVTSSSSPMCAHDLLLFVPDTLASMHNDSRRNHFSVLKQSKAPKCFTNFERPSTACINAYWQLHHSCPHCQVVQMQARSLLRTSNSCTSTHWQL